MKRVMRGFLVGFCLGNALLLARILLVVFSLRPQPSWFLEVVSWIWLASVGVTIPAAIYVAVFHAIASAWTASGDDAAPPWDRLRSLAVPLTATILGATVLTTAAVCLLRPRANRFAREAVYEVTTAALVRDGGIAFTAPSDLPRVSGEMGPFDLARKVEALRARDHSGWAPSRKYSAALHRQIAVSVACLPMSLCAVGLACHRGRMPLPVLWALGCGTILAYFFAIRDAGSGNPGISALVIPWAMLGGIGLVGTSLAVVSRD